MKHATAQRVKELLVEGLSNKEICERLHLSKSAVNYHIAALFRKYRLYGHCDGRRLVVLLVTEKLEREKGNTHEAERRSGQHVHASFSD
jgi:DNA-binding NarL/FixJ family response regulator